MKLIKRIFSVISIGICIPTMYSQTVIPWYTSSDQTKLLQQQSSLSFSVNNTTANATVTVDPTTMYQTMDGFGFCLTEGSAEVISSMTLAQQTTLLNELFSKTSGLGISVLRISIGASDLSSSDYSYNETSGDVNMTNFSLAGPDLNYLIPVLKTVLSINPDIKILATPWSAPRWMKTNSSWIGGSLNTAYYAAYAKYFVKYIDAMKAQGINIWAITPQNEPENPNNNPSMSMTAAEEVSFINNNLGPSLATAGYGSVKIIGFDHNCDNATYPIYVCNNSLYVDGAAFHLYAGAISTMTTVKNATSKNVYFTEQYTASTGSFSGDFAWHMQNVVIGSATNWGKTIIEWNLANNSNIGPYTSGGCSTCLGAITINNSTTYTRNVSYYIIGQISKFVKSGATRIGATVSGTSLMATAFQNPDGTIAVLAYNSKSSSQTLKVLVGLQSFVATVPANTAATFVWSTISNAIPSVALNQISLSPNPGNSFVKLKQSDLNEKYKSVSFYTTSGSLALNQLVPDNETETLLNTASLAPSVYLVKVLSDNHQYYTRFIKQ
ncbi:MAG: glycoside hydrolase family 30 beta sandwich domain-containing protein [Paludibacter sp.]|nr:glycoside hydrolase family 30 beta sandwich domain-containing protein [Paludibacter sp.]